MMIKPTYIFTSAALVLVSVQAAADGISGMYIQGDFGAASLRASAEFAADRYGKRTFRQTNPMPRISVGYDFGDVRMAGDYTHYGQAEHQGRDTDAQSVGLAVVYDIDVNAPVQPYIGTRLSANRIKSGYRDNQHYQTHSKTRVSPGVLAGVNYQFDRRLALDAGYRYNHLDTHLKTHELSVGIRYTFN